MDITLDAVSSTLLIPLAARAQGGASFPWMACQDRQAAATLSELNVDVSIYLRDHATVLNILWRTQVLKQAGQDFFAHHPESLGVCLGCGLSDHFQWFDQGRNHWMDVDLPAVMALRQPLIPMHSRRQTQGSSCLKESGWWQRLGLPSGPQAKPVFLLCEGVLMYLTPDQVANVLREFGEHAPAGSRFLLDTMSHVAIGMAKYHPSVSRTGAEFRWGLRSMDELTAPHPRLRLLSSRSVSECYGLTGQATEALWRPWITTPMYGMVELGVDAQ